jgi:hypothetical protein
MTRLVAAFKLASVAVLLSLSANVHGYLSPLCCGDNFCCSVMSDQSVSCWGGQTFSAPSGNSFKAVACAGKTLVTVGTDDKIKNCVGTTGYGVTECQAYIGTVVKDVSVSFWGGALVKNTGELASWSQPTVYGTNGQPTLAQCTSNDCSAQSMALTNPTNGYFAKIACGGKRAGHFCCAVLDDSDTSGGSPVQCWGDAGGQYTPTAAQLASLNYKPYSISAGCDFICTLNASGKLGVYGHHENGELTSRSHPDTTAPPSGLYSSGPTYVQAACGTFVSLSPQQKNC